MDDITALLMGRNKKVGRGLRERAVSYQSTRMEKKERVRSLLRVASWRTSCVNAARMKAMADSVETLGVDLRTRVKRLGEEVQGEILACQEEQCLPKELHEGAGLVPARTWEVHAVEMAPSERYKLRRQMAAAAGKKSTTSLSLFMETCGPELEEELSSLATQHWAEVV